MNRWQNVPSKKPFAPANERCSPRSSSDCCSSKYSTCSDYEIRDAKNDVLENMHGCEDVRRAMGKSRNLYQLTSQNVLNSTEDTLDDTCYSVDVLDQNLDVFTDDEAYTDCEDASLLKLDQLTVSDFGRPDHDEDSTVYVPPPTLSRIGNMNSDNFYKLTSNKINSKSAKSGDKSSSMFSTEYQNNQDRLVTICEVTEHTRNSNSLSFSTTVFSKNTSKGYAANLSEIQFDGELRDYNKNIPEKVPFTKPSSIAKLKELSQRERDYLRKNIKIANNNHNTTESFVQWEKLFKTTEHLDSRRSKSNTDLSLKSDDYNGDAECTDKNLDLSVTLSEVSMIETMSQKKHSIYRTKSCDSLLEEVKHLPHVFYEKFDKFLESLSKEIENIRSQSVVCTCNKKCVKKFSMQDHSNHLRPSSVRSSVKTCNGTANTTEFVSKTKKSMLLKSPTYDKVFLSESDAYSEVSPVQNRTSGSRTSPNLLRVPSPVYCADNSHCSPKTPTKKRGLYPWEKEVVSPVGEYIKGKRPSPFQNSPVKRS